MDVMTVFPPVELQRIRKILEEILSLDRQIEEYLLYRERNKSTSTQPSNNDRDRLVLLANPPWHSSQSVAVTSGFAKSTSQ